VAQDGQTQSKLTFLLFLKMADEQSRPPFNKPSPIPKNVDWQSLMRLDGDELRIIGTGWPKEILAPLCSFTRKRKVTRSNSLPWMEKPLRS